jgi:hypothetical protein
LVLKVRIRGALPAPYHLVHDMRGQNCPNARVAQCFRHVRWQLPTDVQCDDITRVYVCVLLQLAVELHCSLGSTVGMSRYCPQCNCTAGRLRLESCYTQCAVRSNGYQVKSTEQQSAWQRLLCVQVVMPVADSRVGWSYSQRNIFLYPSFASYS